MEAKTIIFSNYFSRHGNRFFAAAAAAALGIKNQVQLDQNLIPFKLQAAPISKFSCPFISIRIHASLSFHCKGGTFLLFRLNELLLPAIAKFQSLPFEHHR